MSSSIIQTEITTFYLIGKWAFRSWFYFVFPFLPWFNNDLPFFPECLCVVYSQLIFFIHFNSFRMFSVNVQWWKFHCDGKKHILRAKQKHIVEWRRFDFVRYLLWCSGANDMLFKNSRQLTEKTNCLVQCGGRCVKCAHSTDNIMQVGGKM